MKKRVLITGASGLVGEALSRRLIEEGCEVVALGRRSEADFRTSFSLPCRYFQWAEPTEEKPPLEAFDDVDAVVNLAGESVGSGRWTTKRKQGIHDSRVLGTQNLVDAIKEVRPDLPVFVSASAIGFYGDRGEEVLNEQSGSGEDFLSEVTRNWESAVDMAPGRIVKLRIGVVLARQGGALAEMEPVFEKGLGGSLGSGRQWMSWIHLDDLVEVFWQSIIDERWSGAINAVAPQSVRNREFGKCLAQSLLCRTFLPAPAVMLRIFVGEFASVLLSSQRVEPRVMQRELGFCWKYARIEDALGEIYAWKESSHDRLFFREQWVPHQRDKVFPFFCDEKNLEKLTPDFLGFRVVGKSTEEIQEGTEIQYRLKIHGVPAQWKSRIQCWSPGRSFQDIQLQGPYSKWEHTHGFDSLGDGTLLWDQVVYRMPLAGIGGNWVLPLVKRDISGIFDYRKKVIDDLFGIAA